MGFPALPPVDASDAELLDWLKQVKDRSPEEIAANVYKIEEVYSSLPATTLGAVRSCPPDERDQTLKKIEGLLDEHAHCSDECELCKKKHCLPRTPKAKEALEGLGTDLSKAAMKIVSAVDLTDQTKKGDKAALEQVAKKLSEGAMIGALVCTDSQGKEVILYGSTGSQPKQIDKSLQRLASVAPLPLSPALDSAKGTFHSVGSGNDPEKEFKISDFKTGSNPPGACAAQRMLQEALEKGLTPVGMAEMWFGSSKGGDRDKQVMPRATEHLYGSCPTCRRVMATMLCPQGGTSPKG